jgi:hypothetical protein
MPQPITPLPHLRASDGCQLQEMPMRDEKYDAARDYQQMFHQLLQWC